MSASGLQAKEGPSAQGAGLYVHVPFCASMCRYCAFYKTPPRREAVRGWMEGVFREWAARPEGADASTFETCFFGGGTPGTLPTEDFLKIGKLFAENGCDFKEWTVELSPSTAKPKLLETLKKIGVTRLSMGVQSFSDDLLGALGRRSTAAQVRAAIGEIKKAGFDNFNLDLMIALPGQGPERLLEDLNEAASHNPAHISTYCLTLEDDGPLLAALSARGWRPDLGRERECYLAAWQRLPELGYAHYEVSNFARPGRECIHNLNTWRMGQWLGLGPSSASQWRGRRWANIPDTDAWRTGLDNGRPALTAVSTLTPADLLADCLIFGLRLNAGVDLAQLTTRFGENPVSAYAPLWERLETEGLLIREGTRILLSTEGRMLTDAVGLAVLEIT